MIQLGLDGVNNNVLSCLQQFKSQSPRLGMSTEQGINLLQSIQERYAVQIKKKQRNQDILLKRRIFMETQSSKETLTQSDVERWKQVLNTISPFEPQLWEVIEEIKGKVCSTHLMQVFAYLKQYELLEVLDRIGQQIVGKMKQVDKEERDNIKKTFKRVLWILAMAPELVQEVPFHNTSHFSCQKLFKLFQLSLRVKELEIEETILCIIRELSSSQQFVSEFLKSQFFYRLLEILNELQLGVEEHCSLFEDILNNLGSGEHHHQSLKLMVDSLFSIPHSHGFQCIQVFSTYMILFNRVTSKDQWVFTTHYKHLQQVLSFLINNESFETQDEKRLRSKVTLSMDKVCIGVKRHQSESQCTDFLTSCLIPIFLRTTSQFSNHKSQGDQSLSLLTCLFILSQNHENTLVIWKQKQVVKQILFFASEKRFQLKKTALLLVQKMITLLEFEDVYPLVSNVFGILCEELIDSTDNELLIIILKSLIMVFRIEAQRMEKQQEDNPQQSKHIPPCSKHYNPSEKFDFETKIGSPSTNQYWRMFQSHECYNILEQLSRSNNETIQTLVQLIY